MKKTNRSIPSPSLLLAALALAPLAVAQVGGSAGGSVGGSASVNISPVVPPTAPVVPPTAPVSPPVSPVIPPSTPSAPSVAAGSNGSTSAGTKSDANSAKSDSSASAGVSADANLSPTGRMTAETLFALGASGSLDSDNTLKEIRAAEMSARTDLLADVEMRFEASQRAVRDLERDSTRLTAGARQTYNAALEDFRAKEKALNETIASVQSTRNESWTAARAKLAADYDAYAKAVAKLETSLKSTGNAIPATPAIPATRANPGMGTPATPATPAVPATPSSSSSMQGGLNGSASSAQ